MTALMVVKACTLLTGGGGGVLKRVSSLVISYVALPAMEFESVLYNF